MKNVLPRVGRSLSPESLTDVYLELRPRLERVIAHRVGSKAIASDLASEIFFKIKSIQAKLATRTDAERYFLRVAMNLATDYLRVENRRREILDEHIPDFQQYEPSPEEALLDKDTFQQVEDALSELPEKCRTVLFLSRIEGLTHREIAERLGVSRSLVEKLIMRALLHCRSRLQGQG